MNEQGVENLEADDRVLENVKESDLEEDVVASVSEDLRSFAAALGKSALALVIGFGVVLAAHQPSCGSSRADKVQWEERQQQVAEMLEAKAHVEKKAE